MPGRRGQMLSRVTKVPSSDTPAIAPGTAVGSAALADRESGQPVSGYVEQANGHGLLP